MPPRLLPQTPHSGGWDAETGEMLAPPRSATRADRLLGLALGLAAAGAAWGAFEATGAEGQCEAPLQRFQAGACAALALYAVYAARGFLSDASRSHALHLFVTGGSSLALVWGAVGAHYTAACASHAPGAAYGLAVLTATALLLTAVGVGVLSCYWSVAILTPDDEDAAILVCLRCSCFSLRTQRLLCALPFAACSIVSLCILLTHRADHESCDQPLMEFLWGVSGLFMAYAVCVVFVFFGRRPGRRTLLALTLTGSVSGIAWAVAGTVWIANGNASCRVEAPHLFAAAVLLKVILLVVASVVFFFAVCCKIETFLYVGRSEDLLSVTELRRQSRPEVVGDDVEIEMTQR